MSKDYPFTPEEFKAIYSQVPRLCVDLIFTSPEGTYLTLRDIEPCKGKWHMAGGTIFFGETFLEAAERVAKRELGVDIMRARQVGVIELPDHSNDSFDHPISIVYEVEEYRGELAVNKEASKGGWFKELPKGIHEGQDDFLVEEGYLARTS